MKRLRIDNFSVKYDDLFLFIYSNSLKMCVFTWEPHYFHKTWIIEFVKFTNLTKEDSYSWKILFAAVVHIISIWPSYESFYSCCGIYLWLINQKSQQRQTQVHKAVVNTL